MNDISPLIISVSGVRGVMGKTLTEAVAARYALAASALLPKGPLLITRDSRPSGQLLADAIAQALTQAGRAVIAGGIVATPTTGILIRQHQAAGGIQISASHNPSQYNGLKLFNEQGRIVPGKQGEQVADLFRKIYTTDGMEAVFRRNEGSGGSITLPETTSAHLEAILRTVDVDLIRKKKFRVLLDSNHGAGIFMGRELLRELGCEAIFMGEPADGQFAHPPEPTAENLRQVAQAAVDQKVDIAFCQDPDADRVAFFDATGHYPGEEYTLVLSAWNRLEKEEQTNRHDSSPLVINCATSRMNLDLAEKFGRKCFVSPVGEANVVDRMIAERAFFGGEGNGGPIDPAVGLVRDSFVAIANILELMARTGKSVAQLVDEIPKYSILKMKIDFPLQEVSSLLAFLEERFSGMAIDRQDGLRIDYPDGWVLVRGSNTEPIVRIIAESRTADRTKSLCEDIIKKIGVDGNENYGGK